MKLIKNILVVSYCLIVCLMAIIDRVNCSCLNSFLYARDYRADPMWTESIPAAAGTEEAFRSDRICGNNVVIKISNTKFDEIDPLQLEPMKRASTLLLTGVAQSVIDENSTVPIPYPESLIIFVWVESDISRVNKIPFGNIRELNLSRNKIMKIDKSAFDPIKSSVEVLDLSRNSLTSLHPDTLNGASKLRSLWLSDNQFVRIPEIVATPSLLYVALPRNEIDEVDFELLKLNPQLRAIYLNDNNVGSLSMDIFVERSELEILNLAGNSIVEIPDDLFNRLPMLKRLELKFNRIQDGLNDNTFSGLERLEYLNLIGNQLKRLPSGLFESNERLTELNLARNNITELTLANINNLKRLRYLNISHNPISDEHLPDGMFNFLPNLRTLDMSRCQLKRLPRSIITLRSLERLQIENNSVLLCDNDMFWLGQWFRQMPAIRYQHSCPTDNSLKAYFKIPQFNFYISPTLLTLVFFVTYVFICIYHHTRNSTPATIIQEHEFRHVEEFDKKWLQLTADEMKQLVEDDTISGYLYMFVVEEIKLVRSEILFKMHRIKNYTIDHMIWFRDSFFRKKPIIESNQKILNYEKQYTTDEMRKKLNSGIGKIEKLLAIFKDIYKVSHEIGNEYENTVAASPIMTSSNVLNALRKLNVDLPKLNSRVMAQEYVKDEIMKEHVEDIASEIDNWYRQLRDEIYSTDKRGGITFTVEPTEPSFQPSMENLLHYSKLIDDMVENGSKSWQNFQ